MRLSEKKYKVAVLEMGKRFRKDDFPKSNWNIRKYLWAPFFRCFGFQKISFLKGVMLLHGTGVGGGSLVYANTLMTPSREIFDGPDWPRGIQWWDELKDKFQIAKKMLGVTTNKALFAGEQALEKLSHEMGCAETYHPTEVGVFFGEPNKTVSDPYFDGQGPERTGCNFCGGCMVGCRFGAKNTLDYNYLYFAEKNGAKVIPEVRVEKIIPIRNGYELETVSLKGQRRKYFAKSVILSAGVLGTTELLLKNREVYKTLPLVSEKLGDTVRTNGESLLGATSFQAHRELSRGIAIGSAFHPDSNTKIENVRYPAGSDFMRLIAVPLTGSGGPFLRPLKLLWRLIARFPRFLRLWLKTGWAENSVILLVMQSIDQKMNLTLGRSWQNFFRRGLKGSLESSVQCYFPVAQNAAQKLSEIIDGEPQNVFSEVVFGTPATAHILGGCRIGESSKSGVVSSNHEVFGYKGLYVCDGSVIPANLAVNPSLTITALAERFCDQFPVNV